MAAGEGGAARGLPSTMRFIDFSGTSTSQLRVIRLTGGLAVLLWVGFLVIAVSRSIEPWHALVAVAVVAMGTVIVGVHAELRERSNGGGEPTRR
jgi:hypothetical protein